MKHKMCDNILRKKNIFFFLKCFFFFSFSQQRPQAIIVNVKKKKKKKKVKKSFELRGGLPCFDQSEGQETYKLSSLTSFQGLV